MHEIKVRRPAGVDGGDWIANAHMPAFELMPVCVSIKNRRVSDPFPTVSREGVSDYALRHRNRIDAQPKGTGLQYNFTLPRWPTDFRLCGNQVINATPNRKVGTMKAKEQFALALRIIGVLGIMYVLRTFVRNPSPAIVVLIIRLVFAVIGVYLIRGAPQLVRFAYPESAPETPEKTNA